MKKQTSLLPMAAVELNAAMTVHLIKLSVGSESLSDLAAWQAQRLKDMQRKRQTPELIHLTLNTPRRAQEILDGGSIYWVIKGMITARQRLLELRPMVKNGVPHCGLVYAKELVPVRRRPRRAFQGWRYLEPKDAPPDLVLGQGIEQLPEKLQRELIVLGLL